jgi:hypothetical protein
MVSEPEIQYKYTLVGATYITEGEPLFDFQADCIEGRCTHVWKVYSEADLHRCCPFVLKDFWMHYDDIQEGAFLNMLHKELPKKGSSHFLTVAAHEVVKIGDHQDDTHVSFMHDGIPDVLRYETIKAPQGTRVPRTSVQGSNRSGSTGHTPIVTPPPQLQFRPPMQFTCRLHYRILFHEVGTPVHELLNFDDIYNTLITAVKGMFISLCSLNIFKYLTQDSHISMVWVMSTVMSAQGTSFTTKVSESCQTWNIVGK